VTSPALSAQAAPPPSVAPAAPVGKPQTMTERDRSMLARADRLLREGDVAAARLLLAHLAQKGIAEGALAMARSYDPDVLVTLRVAGLEPDPAQARDWYRRAEQLGSTQATARLSTLNIGGR
jgi:TPR repeat protein